MRKTLRVAPILTLLMLVSATAAADIAFYRVPPEGVKTLANWAGMIEDDLGRIYVSCDDHAGQAGNSWLQRFDPETETFTTVLDVRRDAGDLFDAAGLGHGKIHVPPRRGPDGRIYVSTFHYDDPKDAVTDYQGSLLFSLDPRQDGPAQCHGVIFPHQGTVAADFLAGDTLYAAWVQPAGRFMVWDMVNQRVHLAGLQADDQRNSSTRLCGVLGDAACYQNLDGTLWRYDPAHGEQKLAKLPDLLRTLQAVSATEWLGVTNEGRIMLFDSSREMLTPLLHALDRDDAGKYYVPDFALSADRRTAYYVGGTENRIGDYTHDNPVIACQFRTGQKRVLARLNTEMQQRKLGRLRWNFGCLVTRDQQWLYLCPNASAGTHVYLAKIALTP